MRQGKLSELIHNSARHPDLDECSVEVHFREIIDLPGPDVYTVIPNSSLVVSLTEVDRLAEKAARLKIVEKEKAKLDAERKKALAGLKLANEPARALSWLGQYYLLRTTNNSRRRL
ncbi:hypothetical protein P692DRAFT_201865718 [Suillus brevipes Sb2]|nr:hypothetical protein P692DRAFT_201865718 [Suillus brevipes Sb2]